MQTTLDILTTSIPFGGYGRPLTSTERRRLRKAAPGCPVSERMIVLRRHDQPTVGTLYEPTSDGRCYTLSVFPAVGIVTS